ncbi:MFS transporter [Saccharothrix syringae]|uniref:MFS transporter n=1 Tax=Saccharothrix syringae TaxID=103733 RepID=A0A5Q0GTT6_SACSY|nr:MFS transporter [Saccharothrix syringae]QFZ17035.1 MFS transporter [Saccharothrix syringae]
MTGDTQVRAGWAPVVALAMAMVAVTTEMSLAAVALPALGAELGVGPSAAAWVLPAYTLPMAALAVPAGRWVDRVDVRWAFALALVGVGVSSLVTALAPVFWVVLVGRVAQGLAAALVLAGYMPIVVAAVPAERRGRAMGSIVTMMTVGGMAGAPLGGFVAGALGWRAVFLVKLPVVVAALWLGWRSLRGDGRGLPPPDRGLVLEAVLLGGAVAGVLLAFGGPAWTAAVAVVPAVWWARLPGSRPVLALVRRRVFGLPLLALALMSTLGGLLFFLVPYQVTGALGGTSGQVGLVLLVYVSGVAVLSVVAGALTDRCGPWPVALVGAVVSVLGMASLLLPVTSLVDLGWRLFAVGVGQGLFNPAVNALVVATAPAGAAGAAGGLGSTARMVGTTVGPALAVGGFHSGVAVLTATAVLGVTALACARR